ncbi:hypothetical protein ONS96_013315 [Cadophora gregata f. sp. sojae]|nr:hypothetical protein ONS96_013315 [Cadophora gregata f. sp. sojae]
MFLILFATCLWYVPSDTPRKRVIALYISFLLISVVPLLIDLLNPSQDPEEEFWGSVIFSFVHTQLISPLVTVGAMAALYYQWPNAGAAALSQDGLAVQAVVFATVALSWTARVRFQPDGGDGHGGTSPDGGLPVKLWLWLKVWYQLVGWAAVDNAVLALVQAALFFTRRRETSVKSDGEEEPLLGH